MSIIAFIIASLGEGTGGGMVRGVEGPDDVLGSMGTASANGEGGGASLPV